MSVAAIVQTRMGSTRLPEKALTDLCGQPVLWHIYHRVRAAKTLDAFLIATTDKPQDDAIARFAKAQGIPCFRGSESNVLERFYLAAKTVRPDVVVRLTGDNVMIDPVLVDKGVQVFLNSDLDYLYYRQGLPIGMAVEIFRFAALEKSYFEASDPECLEHVTPYIYRNPDLFHCKRWPCEGEDRSTVRWTLDTPEDFRLIQNMYAGLYPHDPLFTYEEAIRWYDSHPEWKNINGAVVQKTVKYQGQKGK